MNQTLFRDIEPRDYYRTGTVAKKGRDGTEQQGPALTAFEQRHLALDRFAEKYPKAVYWVFEASRLTLRNAELAATEEDMSRLIAAMQQQDFPVIWEAMSVSYYFPTLEDVGKFFTEFDIEHKRKTKENRKKGQKNQVRK